MTPQSAPLNTHFNPNHRAKAAKVPTTTVRVPLNQLLSRLSRIQPTAPVWDSGGEILSAIGSWLAIMAYLRPKLIWRLYRFPTRE